MEEQITKELIQYKTGFQSGKDEVIELTKLGKVILLNKEKIDKTEESWFNYGYNDAMEFYLKKVSEGVDILEIRTKDVIKELFTKRVIKYNSQNNKKVAISTFKII